MGARAQGDHRIGKDVNAVLGEEGEEMIEDRIFPITMENIHLYKDGEPCTHKGCKHHVKHPCEGCGRIMASGEAWARGSVLTTEQAQAMNRKREEKKVKK